MEKTKLNRFISKYFLNGNVESVAWHSNGNLSVKFVDDTKSLIGEVSCGKINFPNSEFGINQTSKLKTLLSVLGDKVDVKLKGKNGINSMMNISDDNVDINYVLSDLSIIPKVPNLKAAPTWDLVINVDDKFIDNFVKSSQALSEVKEFAVVTKDNTVKFVIGHSNVNSTNIVVNVDAKTYKDINLVYFSASHMKEILIANKEAKNGKIEICERGLARITFNVDDFKSQYFMVSRQV